MQIHYFYWGKLQLHLRNDKKRGCMILKKERENYYPRL